MPQQYDAILIGGGPAGAVSALLLARQGWRIVLLEKGLRNRAKTCGHCLDARATRTLHRAGLLSQVRHIATGTICGANIYLPGMAPLQWSLNREQHGPSLVVQRQSLDQLLLDAAQREGVHIRQPAHAVIQSVSPGQCQVTTNGDMLAARLLIGADGLGSRVARAASLHRTMRCTRKYGFSFSIGADAVPAIETGLTHMFVTRDGYLGLVHEAPGRLHCASLVNSPQVSPREFLHRVSGTFTDLRGIACANESNIIAAGPMPCGSVAAANESAALVGDAAGYIEPFTGEGMTWAMQSAELLARATATFAPGHWCARSAAIYRELWQRHIARRQRFCRLMAWLLHRTHFMVPVMHIARSQPRLIRTIAQEVLAA